MCVSFFLFLFVCAAICTVVWKSQGLRCRYWPLPCPLSIRSFACTAYLFVFFALLASLASSAALIHLLACSLAHFAHSQARGKVYDLICQYHLVLNHSGLTRISQFHPFMLNFTTQLSLCVSVSLPLSPSLSVCLSFSTGCFTGTVT